MRRDFMPRTVPHQPRFPARAQFARFGDDAMRGDPGISKNGLPAPGTLCARAQATGRAPQWGFHHASETLTPSTANRRRGWIRRGEHSRRAAAAAGRASPQVFTPQAAVPLHSETMNRSCLRKFETTKSTVPASMTDHSPEINDCHCNINAC